jgi:hypothetical protein
VTRLRKRNVTLNKNLKKKPPFLICFHREDVYKYNNIVLRKNISQFEILHVNMDSNATNVQHVTT